MGNGTDESKGINWDKNIYIYGIPTKLTATWRRAPKRQEVKRKKTATGFIFRILEQLTYNLNAIHTQRTHTRHLHDSCTRTLCVRTFVVVFFFFIAISDIKSGVRVHRQFMRHCRRHNFPFKQKLILFFLFRSLSQGANQEVLSTLSLGPDYITVWHHLHSWFRCAEYTVRNHSDGLWLFYFFFDKSPGITKLWIVKQEIFRVTNDTRVYGFGSRIVSNSQGEPRRLAHCFWKCCVAMSRRWVSTNLAKLVNSTRIWMEKPKMVQLNEWNMMTIWMWTESKAISIFRVLEITHFISERAIISRENSFVEQFSAINVCFHISFNCLSSARTTVHRRHEKRKANFK